MAMSRVGPVNFDWFLCISRRFLSLDPVKIACFPTAIFGIATDFLQCTARNRGVFLQVSPPRAPPSTTRHASIGDAFSWECRSLDEVSAFSL